MTHRAGADRFGYPAAIVAAACAAALLAACGTAQPPPPGPVPADDAVPVPPSAAAPAPVLAAGYEQRLRERAADQARQGRLAEAAVSWEILTLLRPESADYRERLAETRRQISSAVPERLQRAKQAAKRGDLDAATAQYLAVLALQPDQAEAADALRGLERERNRRNYLGKPSRITLTRRSVTDSQMNAPNPAVPLDRNEVEHAAMLGTQGEYDDAIVLLQRHLAVDKRDTAACQLLAEMYYQKGEKLLPRDKPGATLAFDRSFRLDPGNTRAAARLKSLRDGTGPAPAARGGTAQQPQPCSSAR